MNEETFLQIYNEASQSSYSDFEDVLTAFIKWKDAQAKANSAYGDIQSIKSGSDYWWYDAEKDMGRRQAAKYRQDAFDRYGALAKARDKAKDEFNELLDSTPDLTAKVAYELLGNQKLGDYLQNLEDKHIRFDSSNAIQKDGLPRVNEKITVEVETQKLTAKLYPVGDKKGTYLTVTDKNGLHYSMFVFEDSINKIQNNDIYKVSGAVKEIKDFYGKDQVNLKSPKFEFYPMKVNCYTELDPIIDKLSSEGKLTTVKNKDDIPASAKPYVFSYKDDTHDYIVNEEYHNIYRDKTADKYYYYIEYNRYTLD